MNIVFLISIVLVFNLSLSYQTNRFNNLNKKIPLSKISIKDKWFVDEYNRVVIFHGINAVRKEYPWIPNSKDIDLTNQTQVLNLKKWGFNVVRLGVMWSGLMPNKDFLNKTYLNEMVKIVNYLAENDIYVIIDLHQDMMSSKFNSYDGVPLWVMNQLPDSKFQFPWPLKNQTLNASVFAAYITESCGYAFQCLYDNVNNFSDYFLQYWTVISNTFSNISSVLGYELLNEPWAGDVYANPLLLLPGFAGNKNLMKLYDKAYEIIRNFDKNTLVFYEPVTWGVMLNRNYFGTGFNRPPGNDPTKTVLSWHYYCWLLNFRTDILKNGTYPKLDRVVCDNIQLKISFETIKLDMIELGGGPSFLTEFGVCAFAVDDSKTSKLNTDECNAVLDAADKYLQSWAYWDSRFYNLYTLQEIPEIIDIFARVYPMATNGIPLLFNYNATSKQFSYSYKLNLTSIKQCKLPTEIHIPPNVYPLGFDVVVSSNLKWSYDKVNYKIYIYIADHILEIFNQNKKHKMVEKADILIYSLVDLF